MNPTEHTHPTPEHTPAPEKASAPESTRAEAGEITATGAPDAVQAADVDHQDQVDPAKARARGVDWVRTSDLMARGSAAASRLAIDFEANLAHKAHDSMARGLTHLGAKARELPPLSSFGRGTTHQGAERGPVGMS